MHSTETFINVVMCVIGFFSLLCVDWVHLKLRLGAVAGVRGGAVSSCCCTGAVCAGCCCTRAASAASAHERRGEGPKGRGAWAAHPGVPCSALLSRQQLRIWPAASLEYCFAALIIASWKDTIYFCCVRSVLAFCLLFYSQNPWFESTGNAVKSSKMSWNAAYSFTGWFLFFFLLPALWALETRKVYQEILGVSGDCCRDLIFPVGYADWASLSGQQEAFFLR